MDPKSFSVVKINELSPRPGVPVNKMLSIGDTLLSIDERILGQVCPILLAAMAETERNLHHSPLNPNPETQEGNTVEKLIPGDKGTYITLHFRDLETGLPYDM